MLFFDVRGGEINFSFDLSTDKGWNQLRLVVTKSMVGSVLWSKKQQNIWLAQKKKWISPFPVYQKKMNLTIGVRSRHRVVPRVQVWVSWVRIWWRVRISVRFGRSELYLLLFFKDVFFMLNAVKTSYAVSNFGILPKNLVCARKPNELMQTDFVNTHMITSMHDLVLYLQIRSQLSEFIPEP